MHIFMYSPIYLGEYICMLWLHNVDSFIRRHLYFSIHILLRILISISARVNIYSRMCCAYNMHDFSYDIFKCSIGIYSSMYAFTYPHAYASIYMCSVSGWMRVCTWQERNGSVKENVFLCLVFSQENAYIYVYV